MSVLQGRLPVMASQPIATVLASSLSCIAAEIFSIEWDLQTS